MSNIERLEALTKELPTLRDFIATPPGAGSTVEYNINGTVIGCGLWKDNHIAVQRAFMSAGTTFPHHAHTEREWCIVISGSFTLHMEDEDRECVAGDFVYFAPGEKHGVTAHEDTWTLFVTMPPSEGYPNA